MSRPRKTFDGLYFAWAAAALLAVLLLGVAARVRGEGAWLPWYAGVVLTGPLMVAAARSSRISRWAIRLLAATVGAVALATVLTASGLVGSSADGTRVALFAGHANGLAAQLVVATAALLSLRLAPRWTYLVPLVAVATLATGSRTGLAALVASSLVWGLGPWSSRRIRFGTIAGLALLGTVIGSSALRAHFETSNANLLRTSVRFADAAWRSIGDGMVDVQSSATWGPRPFSRADRLVLASGEESVVALAQGGFGASEAGVAYVASVYLRADRPQSVVIRTRLSSVTCDVTSEWTRCRTPPGLGNGTKWLQFRIEPEAEVGSMDVLAWGPQLERGTAVSTYQATGVQLIPQRILRRFSPSSISDGDPARLAAWRVASSTFLSHPWTGVGEAGVKGALAASGVESNGRSLGHAHNFVLQRLAAEGALGAVAWLLLFAPPWIVALRRQGGSMLVLLVALAITNATDATFFLGGVYASTWLALGVAWWSLPRRT